MAGTFTYSPPEGTVLQAGDGQTLSVTFTPADLTTYRTTTASVLINVAKATPLITWPRPAAIAYGTSLDATQLKLFTANYVSALIPDMKSYTLYMHDLVFAKNGVKRTESSALMFQYACRALSRLLPGFAKIVEVHITPGTDITGSWDAPINLMPEPPAKAAGAAPKAAAQEPPKEEIIEVCSVTHRQVEETLKKDLLILAALVDAKNNPSRDLVAVSGEPGLTGKSAPKGTNSVKLENYDKRLKDLSFRDIAQRLFVRAHAV